MCHKQIQLMLSTSCKKKSTQITRANDRLPPVLTVVVEELSSVNDDGLKDVLLHQGTDTGLVMSV